MALEGRLRRLEQVLTGPDESGADKSDWSADWTPHWTVPSFDEWEWAARIRGHIDAWRAETAEQSRRGDIAALSLGTPLLLADLFFLGGAGLTLTWAAVWTAGFFGGKGLVRVFES